MIRPTPETESNKYPAWKYYDDPYCVDASFAEELERERDEARELARGLLADLDRLSHWRFPYYADDCGIIAEIDSVIGKFEERVKL